MSITFKKTIGEPTRSAATAFVFAYALAAAILLPTQAIAREMAPAPKWIVVGALVDEDRKPIGGFRFTYKAAGPWATKDACVKAMRGDKKLIASVTAIGRALSNRVGADVTIGLACIDSSAPEPALPPPLPPAPEPPAGDDI